MGEASPSLKPVFTVFPYPLCRGSTPATPPNCGNTIFQDMALLLTILLFAWFIGNTVRGTISHQGSDYHFREHPIQFIIIQIFILGFALFCLNRFLNEIGIYLI